MGFTRRPPGTGLWDAWICGLEADALAGERVPTRNIGTRNCATTVLGMKPNGIKTNLVAHAGWHMSWETSHSLRLRAGGSIEAPILRDLRI